ncbi:MAG: ATP-binding cassette domain-containing protein [Xanthomonadaceae bacterium]|nr:ATP-binding cassette domain-containing protein [Xanthomonadaceae bacterium]
MTATPILKIEHLGHTYGKFQVIDDISLEIPKGELTALIGPNGAGKTTFYNVVSGRFPPSRGRVFFDGQEITGKPAHKVVPLGMLRSFQITNIFPELSVRDNVLIPLLLQYHRGYSFFRPVKKEKDLYQKADEILGKIGILAYKEKPARELAYGDKRLVEMAIVLARNPKLVLLDEPTAGMNPEETDRMISLIKELAKRFGTTFFLTEHDMKVVFSISRRIFVLHQGGLLATGTPDEIRANPRVREAYLGGEDIQC